MFPPMLYALIESESLVLVLCLFGIIQKWNEALGELLACGLRPHRHHTMQSNHRPATCKIMLQSNLHFGPAGLVSCNMMD
jgi:hypothetical protein